MHNLQVDYYYMESVVSFSCILSTAEHTDDIQIDCDEKRGEKKFQDDNDGRFIGAAMGC